VRCIYETLAQAINVIDLKNGTVNSEEKIH
jgi:hypothetical protein